jgi:redox-sensing transcriptional repressor
MLSMSRTQIRKDLSYVGRYSGHAKGYDVEQLFQELSQLLGLDRQWSMVLVGVGHLGRALIANSELQSSGFVLVDAFDVNAAVIGTRVGQIKVRSTSDLNEYLSQRKIDIGVVAVPADQAALVINQLVAGGVRSILNYTSAVVSVPDHVHMHNIDPALILQSMAYYLKHGRGEFARHRR